MNISLAEIFSSNNVIGIVGISPDETRDSYKVGRYLQKCGYRVIPINPIADIILGERCYPTLESCPIQIEIVDIFRRPEFILPIVKEAVKIKAKVIWMQLGISDQPSHKQAVEHGLTVVMDKCIAEEHARIMTIQP